MRFPVMLTKDNDKQVKELNNTIRKWIGRYEKEKELKIKYKNCYEKMSYYESLIYDENSNYKLRKELLEKSNLENRELKLEIKELKRQLKNKDKGIEAMKDMLEERTTDEE